MTANKSTGNDYRALLSSGSASAARDSPNLEHEARHGFGDVSPCSGRLDGISDSLLANLQESDSCSENDKPLQAA